MSRINAFLAEWFDANAQHVKTFRLNFFPDNTLELLDISTGKMALNRIHYPKVTPQMLFIGSTINVYAKQLNIVDYADQGTRDYCESSKMAGFVIILPQGLTSFGALLTAAHEAGLTISRCKSLNGLSDEALDNLISTLRRDIPGLGGFVGIGIALEVMGDASSGGFPAWCDVLEQVASSLGQTAAEMFYWSPSSDTARQESKLFFSDPNRFPHPQTDEENTTLCLIKPHIFASGEVGGIVEAIIQESYTIAAAEVFRLDLNSATEFFDVYKGVLPKYRDSLDHFVEGPVMGLQLVKPGFGVVDDFREFCGPADVEIAQVLRPSSLRARFGKTQVLNAVHCTDMPEDGPLECLYFFQTLSSI